MPSTFQLLGLDFMVTRDFRVWFIEANNYPLWPKGTPYINELINTLGVIASPVPSFFRFFFLQAKKKAGTAGYEAR